MPFEDVLLLLQILYQKSLASGVMPPLQSVVQSAVDWTAYIHAAGRDSPLPDRVSYSPSYNLVQNKMKNQYSPPPKMNDESSRNLKPAIFSSLKFGRGVGGGGGGAWSSFSI